MRFPVEKTNRTIKGILSDSAGYGLRGRNVHVEEVDPSWAYEGHPDHASLEQANGKGLGEYAGDWVRAYGAIRPTETLAIVVADVPRTPAHARPRSPRAVTIYVPKLDHDLMDVARDALIAGDKATTNTVLKPLGNYAGIARAIIERQVSTFKKAAHPKKNTKRIRQEVDDFLRAQGRL